MARPAQNYCEYFPHFRDMRNHRKVKAIRTKFGITGYAIWSMLLEYITGIDGNEFENSESEIELMAGDFGVEFSELNEIIKYCIRLELLFDRNGFIHSPSLDENLNPVYVKRQKAKELSKKQLRKNGSYCNNNAEPHEDTVTVMPQSKVNKSKEKEIINKEFRIEDFEGFWKRYNKPTDKKKCFEKFMKLTENEVTAIKQTLYSYIKSTPDVKYRKNPLTYLNGKCWQDITPQEQKQADNVSYSNGHPIDVTNPNSFI